MALHTKLEAKPARWSFLISIQQLLAQHHGAQPWKIKSDFMEFFL
jgi:hypothetical protein